MAQPTSYQTILQPTKRDAASTAERKTVTTEPVGSSGVQIYGGYFTEEYLQILRGKLGSKQYDEMHRSDAQVTMLLSAIQNPIKAGNWELEAFSQDAKFVLQKEFVEHCLKEQIDFEVFKHEALTMPKYGFVIFEMINNVIVNHPKFGTYNGLRALAFRSQKTIERWDLERQTGKLLGVEQYVYSDVGDNVYIPGEFLIVITNQKEGDNYEGISALRSMYGPWLRKNLYLKLAAIGLEKYAVGTPLGTIPAGKEKDDEVAAFKQTLSSFSSHEAAYITRPEGWAIEILKSEFDAQKVKELIIMENTEMVNAVVANFLVLGMNGGGGAYALGSDLSDFFMAAIQSYADVTCNALNQQLIPKLIKMNYGEQPGYPKMRVTGINDKAGKELSEIIVNLTNSKVLTPDTPLKDYIRKQYKMPKADPLSETPVDQSTEMQFSESGIQLTDRYVSTWNKNKSGLKELMKEGLATLKNNLTQSLRREYEKLPKASKIKAPLNVTTQGVPAYKSALKEKLAEVAYLALEQAKREVPKNVKLSERIKLAAPRGGYFNALPSIIKNLVIAQATLIADTQVSDLEKIVFFQFASSAGSTEDIDAIMTDIDEAVDPVLEGSTGKGTNLDAAAGDAVSQVTQQARTEFFFDPDVLSGIESFTFTNEDPVSEICQELAGTTWAAGDPDIDQYSPPLHHNCKSRLVPNMKGDSGNPDPDQGTSVSQKALKSITLREPNYKIFMV